MYGGRPTRRRVERCRRSALAYCGKGLVRSVRKSSLLVALAFGGFIGASLIIAWFASLWLEQQHSACVLQCKQKGLAGTVEVVQVKSPQRPDLYVTERQCVCK